MDDIIDFAGKQSGELIRASDWNNLIEAIVARFGALEGALSDARTDIGQLQTDLAAERGRIDDLETLEALVRARYRQLTLSTARSTFAVGERAEIVARVTAFDGSDLDLSNPATRPWVDFVTVWGSLKAAPGFTARAGTGGMTVTVQVNANGEARALLREQTGEALAEEQEQEVTAVLDTMVGGTRIADQFLVANTPASTDLAPAYQVVTAAYERQDTPVMRNYLDGIYLNNPTRTYTPITPVYTLNWRDEYATVMAFVKPDDSPGTADSAMASGSIRVTFRDWVYPWIITQYLPPEPAVVGIYTALFTPQIALGLEPGVEAMFNAVETQSVNLGILGQQKQIEAAEQALITLPAAGQPDYFGSLVGTMQEGLTVQKGMLYSLAVSPGVNETTATGKAIAAGGVRGEVAAAAAADTIRGETSTTVTASEARILDQVRAENTQLQSNLLADNGPVRRAEIIALDAASKADNINIELGRKAGIDLVSQLLAARDLG